MEAVDGVVRIAEAAMEEAAVAEGEASTRTALRPAACMTVGTEVGVARAAGAVEVTAHLWLLMRRGPRVRTSLRTVVEAVVVEKEEEEEEEAVARGGLDCRVGHGCDE